MAIDVSYRDTFSTSAEDLSRTNKNFIINEGVAFDGMKVTQSGTPGMSVVVAPGTGYFYGSGTNSNVMYEFYSDANETVTIGASGVQARIDIICLKVDSSTGVASMVAIAGTPSGSPAVPATPASHYKLAEIEVGISVTTITNANITDRRRSVFVAPTGARNQGLINGKIVPTVASNNLTVAIKTLSDTDPSATNPVGIWIGNNLKWITSATSIATLTAGTNWFNAGSAELATKEIDYFVYAQWDNSQNKVNVGISRIPYARISTDFVADNASNGTNEKYFRTEATGLALETTDLFVNIGRFAATLSATASFNWSVPTFSNANLIQEPIYETRRLSYQPTYSAESPMTWTSVTNNFADYKIVNRSLILYVAASGTTGGSAASTLNVTYPITPFNTGNLIRGGASIQDGGNSLSGFYFIGGTIRFNKIDGTNYGLGGSRAIWGTIPYDL